jgi:hypothetical protein
MKDGLSRLHGSRAWCFCTPLLAIWLVVGTGYSFAQAQRYRVDSLSPAASRMNYAPIITPVSPGSSGNQLREKSVYFGQPPNRAMGSAVGESGGASYRPRAGGVSRRGYWDATTRGPLGMRRRPDSWLVRKTLTNQVPSEPLDQNPEGATTRPAMVRDELESAVHVADGFASGAGTEAILSERRNAYLNAGWVFFKAEKYREACETFSLADAAIYSDPKQQARILKERAEVRLAWLYGAIAAGRYSEATNKLAWLLQADKETGALPDALFLRQIGDIRTRYARPELFDAHMAAMERQAVAAEIEATSRQESPETGLALIRMKALRAFVLWSDTVNRQSRTNARSEARQLAEPAVPPPWRELHAAMVRAEAGGAAASENQDAFGPGGAPTSIRLPWENAGEKPSNSRPTPAGG